MGRWGEVSEREREFDWMVRAGRKREIERGER